MGFRRVLLDLNAACETDDGDTISFHFLQALLGKQQQQQQHGATANDAQMS